MNRHYNDIYGVIAKIDGERTKYVCGEGIYYSKSHAVRDARRIAKTLEGYDSLAVIWNMDDSVIWSKRLA